MPLIGIPPYTVGPGDSLPGHFTVPGSGLAVPAGLEAVLEYNGLLLNVRNNVDCYRLISIDGLGDADIRDSRDVNTSDDGETPYNSFLGGRTIVLTGSITTYSVAKLRDMQQALRAAFADRSKERPLHFRLGDFTKDHIINCKKTAPIAGIEQQTNFRAARDFQITLRAANPRFLSYYQEFFVATTTVAGPPVAPLGTLTNRGNYWAQPVFKIYGPSSSMLILNDTSNQYFAVSSIPASDYFEFNTAKKTLRDSSGNNQWKNLIDGSQYVNLQGQSGTDNPTGENSLFYQGDSPRVEITWNHSWV